MITFLYSTVSFISAVSYIPQLWKVIQSETPCHDISIKTWWIWNYMAVVALLYGVFEIQDLTMSLVSGVNAFFISLTIVAVLYKRRNYPDMVMISEEVVTEFSDDLTELTEEFEDLG